MRTNKNYNIYNNNTKLEKLLSKNNLYRNRYFLSNDSLCFLLLFKYIYVKKRLN